MKPLQEYRAFPEEVKQIILRCVHEIKNIDPAATVVLYGSRARGDAQPDSDYDLLILTDGDASVKSEDLFRQQIYGIELETGAMLSVFLFSNKDWQSPLYKAMPFHENVEKEGVMI